MHVGGGGADGGIALVVAHHHRDAPLAGLVGVGAVQRTPIDDAAVARFEQHRHGVRQALGDRRKAASTCQAPALVAARHHPQAVLRRAARPGHGQVEAVGLAAAVGLFQGDAVLVPMRAPILMPRRCRPFARALVEHALVERHEVVAVDARHHAQNVPDARRREAPNPSSSAGATPSPPRPAHPRIHRRLLERAACSSRETARRARACPPRHPAQRARSPEPHRTQREARPLRPPRRRR